MQEKPTIRQTILKYLVEIIIIVIGVSISIAMNEWQNSRENHKKSIALLEEIRDNLVQDSATLTKNAQFIEQNIKWSAPLVIQNGLDFSNDSLLFLVSLVPNFVPFQGTTVGYTHLEGSGGFSLIQNKALLKDIIDLYNNSYSLLEYFSESENKYIHEQIIPYYNQKIPLFTSKYLVDLGHKLNPFINLVKSDEYRSMVRTQIQLKQQSLFYHQETLKKIRVLLQKIETEIQ